MTVPELEKLPVGEREGFLRLWHTPLHEFTPDDTKRWGYFASRINLGRYEFEERRERAKSLQSVYFSITGRDPYKLQIVFGEMELPDALVPEELETPPGNGYYADCGFAKVAADLDTMRITSFILEGYLKKATPEELASVPGLDSLPVGEWPKKEP